MKKKLLVLSASAILASNFILDNNASALVKETKHKSEALDIVGKKHSRFSVDDYKENLGDLIYKLTLNDFDGYYEPEYKAAYDKYQGKFLAELEALNQFIRENDDPKEIGFTFDRYNKVREALIKNKEDFMREANKIDNSKEDLKRFNKEDFHKGLDRVNELEDKAFMVGRAFGEDKFKDARRELYMKVYLVVGKTENERYDRWPTNKRLLEEMCESLETIIDDFFKEIEYKRPKNITPLKPEMKDNLELIKKFREQVEIAQSDTNLQDSTVKEREDRATKSLEELTKNSREAKAEAERKAKAVAMPLKSYRNDPEAFPHKHLKNQLLIQYPDVAKPVTTYTESIKQTPLPVLKQQVKEEKIDVLKSKRPESALKGMEGESAPVTVVSEPAIKPTAAPLKQEVTQNAGLSGSNNNLSGMSGESKDISYTYNSQPVDVDIITESNEIVLDQHETISGFTTGVSTEAHFSSDELSK